MGLLDRLFGRRRSGSDHGYQQGYDGYQATPQYGGEQRSPAQHGGGRPPQEAI